MNVIEGLGVGIEDRQFTLCVPLEVKPESCSRLSALIEELRIQEDTGEFGIPSNFGRIAREVPSLHFMSLSVFTDADYDPMFILEANFDGASGVMWGQVEAAFGEKLRDMLRCCKEPLDRDRALYRAVTAAGSDAPVAPYLEARTQPPSVFHHGNRGVTRDRVLAEAELFGTVRTLLDDAASAGLDPFRGLEPNRLHAAIRGRLLQGHPWLEEPAPERIPRRERWADAGRLLLFAVALIFVLSLPGVVLAMLLPWEAYLALILVAAVAVWILVWRSRDPLPGTGVPSDFSFWRLLGTQWMLIAAYVVGATLLLIPVVFLVSGLLFLFGYGDLIGVRDAFGLLAPAVALGLLSLIVTVPLLVLWLRFLERRDSSHDAPLVNERILREMVAREDWVAQNHMGSIVLIRPGVLRTIILRVGHLGLGLLLRVKATNGYLGTMRTVHFAHWAFLNNGSRLLFFSNFDHSWDSYLDDFIEKAHVGLTLAWGCGVGFPPTRFLLYDGASHGRRFKAWALASRAVSRFWYSAYPTLTVDQIERNYRIATGLRRPRLTDEEAAAWMEDL